MKKLSLCTTLLALFACIAGCGQGTSTAGKSSTPAAKTTPSTPAAKSLAPPPPLETPASVMKESIKMKNDMVEAIEGVKDNASADAAIAKLEKLASRADQVNKKFNALWKLPLSEEKKKLSEEYEAEMEKFAGRLGQAAAGLANSKASPEKMEKIAELMSKIKPGAGTVVPR